MKRSGFSIIELLIVAAIFLIVAAIARPNVLRSYVLAEHPRQGLRQGSR